MKILIMGNSGAGKSTFANALIELNKSFVYVNNDRVRANITSTLGFTERDRLKQAWVMSEICDIANDSGFPAVADFICPLPEGRISFSPTLIVWINRPSTKNLESQSLFVPPTREEAARLGCELIEVTDENWSDSVEVVRAICETF